MFSMTIPRSMLLHMSYMVIRVVWVACSASISTPVLPVVSARTRQCTVCSCAFSSMSICDRAKGWHKGISSAVFFAAMMPAILAIPSTSPFLWVPARICSRVVFCIRMYPSAIAMRWVFSLLLISTMWACPC